MEKTLIKYPYRFGAIFVTILLYLLFKDSPYLGIIFTFPALLLLLLIEVIILFKLNADTVIKISLYLFLVTILAAVLEIKIVDLLGLYSLVVFMIGWMLSIFNFVKKQKATI